MKKQIIKRDHLARRGKILLTLAFRVEIDHAALQARLREMQAGHIFVDLSPPDAINEDIGGGIVRQHDHQDGQIVQRERRLAVAEALQDSATPVELRLANLHPLTELENCRLILA